MSRQVTIVVIALSALLVSAATWWFFDTYEYRIEEEKVGFKGEARRNTYLAAERFLQKFNMEIASLSTILDLKTMPGDKDVLFIPTGRYDLAPARIEELLTWVRQGGHLIVRARQPNPEKTTSEDDLFNQLGVETFGESGKKLFATFTEDIVDVRVNDKIENKKVEFDKNIWMKATGEKERSWVINGENGSHLLEYQIGDGFITLLSDIRFMENEYIDKYDHASFLYAMVHIDNHKRKLWIIRNDNMPSLLSIIKQKAPLALYLFCTLVLCWLWYSTRRFGPLLQDLKPARRSLREHITSSGFYQWRNNNRSELFLSVKQALIEQIVQVRPLWAKLDEKTLAEKLARISGLDSQSVLSVLQAQIIEKEAEFTQGIEIMSLIRKKL